MKFFVLLFLVLLGGFAYVRYLQPKTWNEYLDKLRAPNAEMAIAPSTGSQSPAFQSPDVPSPSANHARKAAVTIPSTITTLSGKTYTECVLSRATPDGISFTHSAGVAKVLFADLEPSLARQFNYDPAVATQYQQDQKKAEEASDASRLSAVQQQASKAATQQTAPSDTPPEASLSSTELKAKINDLDTQISQVGADLAFWTKQKFDEGDAHGAAEDKMNTDNQQLTTLRNKRQELQNYLEKTPQ